GTTGSDRSRRSPTPSLQRGQAVILVLHDDRQARRRVTHDVESVRGRWRMTLAISIVGLAVATTTLYLTHFRRPPIDLYIAPLTKVDPGGGIPGLQLLFPIGVGNPGRPHGGVTGVTASVLPPGRGGESFLIPLRSFSAFNPDSNRWRFEELAHALAVPP